MTQASPLAITWEPTLFLGLPLVVAIVVIVVLVGRSRRGAGAVVMMVFGVVAGLLAVLTAYDRSGRAGAVPLAILGAGLLVAGAILHTGAKDRAPPA